ncbi:MAG TPA: hypothetical protein VKD71_11400 [Gemmataceae bacterium]|nr:hypothetical protein [Gemmataceae bacterium]
MIRLAILALTAWAVTVSAQTTTPKTPKKKDDAPMGYQKVNLRGFMLYFSDEVLKEDLESKLERKPLEALEQELMVVNKVLPADKVKHLNAVPIWVEWNESLALGNGRTGSAVAVFYGGHQSNLLSEDKNPLKANAVTILRLKSLANEHQPKTDSGRCVTLHELAHAFQHHVVGDNPLVKQTYKQAMERKLYDPELYVATNDREYFAELSCAYLDRLDYFPRNREELKKLDPKGYEMMEKLWGKVPERRDPAAAKTPKLPSPDGDGKYNLRFTSEQLRLGTAVVGELPPKSDWKGRPIHVYLFRARDGRSQAMLQRLNVWQSELRDFGLMTVAADTGGEPEEELKKVARARDLNFPLVGDAEFPSPERFVLPHSLVFDHTGKPVFRGAPLDAEPYIRIAIGKAALARVGRESVGAAARPVADLLETGAPMPQVFAKLSEQLRKATGDGADELKQIQTVLTETGKKALDDATAKTKEDPVAAYFEAEHVRTAYKGTPLEKPANDLMLKLRGTPKVESEMRARPSLEAIKKLDTQLSGREMSFNPKSQIFREENGDLLKKLADAIEKMRKAYPSMRATEEAMKIAERWGVK